MLYYIIPKKSRSRNAVRKRRGRRLYGASRAVADARHCPLQVCALLTLFLLRCVALRCAALRCFALLCAASSCLVCAAVFSCLRCCLHSSLSSLVSVFARLCCCLLRRSSSRDERLKMTGVVCRECYDRRAMTGVLLCSEAVLLSRVLSSKSL